MGKSAYYGHVPSGKTFSAHPGRDRQPAGRKQLARGKTSRLQGYLIVLIIKELKQPSIILKR